MPTMGTQVSKLEAGWRSLGPMNPIFCRTMQIAMYMYALFTWGMAATRMHCVTKIKPVEGMWYVGIFFFLGNLGSSHGPYMDIYHLSEHYLNITVDQVYPSTPTVFCNGSTFFQQDNVSCPTTQIVWGWFAEHEEEMQMLSWPPCHSDIILTEHLCFVL